MPIRHALCLCALLMPIAASAQGDAWVEEARRAAMTLPPRLLGVLQEEIARSGPEGAIGVCSERAPGLAKAASEETGWKIRRTTLKLRNGARSTPDAWERDVLEDFERRLAAGEPAAKLERGEIVAAADSAREYRYMKALPVQKLCLNCHGPAEQLSAPVKARLAALYPDDHAIGYAEGQIRGAISLRKPYAGKP